MLTLKKSAMKYKSSDGSMQDVNAIIGQEVTDLTLTKTGIAADAKVVGDKFTEQQYKIDDNFLEAKLYINAVSENINSSLTDYYLKTEANALHAELHDYVDAEVAALVGTAPETLNTIEELADAFEENHDMIETLNEAITYKADKTELDNLASKDYVESKIFEWASPPPSIVTYHKPTSIPVQSGTQLVFYGSTGGTMKFSTISNGREYSYSKTLNTMNDIGWVLWVQTDSESGSFISQTDGRTYLLVYKTVEEFNVTWTPSETKDVYNWIVMTIN